MVSPPRSLQGSLRSVQSNEDLRSMLATRRKSTLSDRDVKEMSEDVQKLIRSHSLIKGKGKGKERASLVATIEEEDDLVRDGGRTALVGLGLLDHELVSDERSTTSMSASTTTTLSEDGGAAIIDAFPAPPVHLPGHSLPSPSSGSFSTSRGQSTLFNVAPIKVPDRTLFLSSSTPNLKTAKRRTKSSSPLLPVSPSFSPLFPPSLPLPPLPSSRRGSTDSALSPLTPPPAIPLPPLPSPLLTLSLYNEQQRSFPLYPNDLSDDETSPIDFDDLISAPLPKRHLSALSSRSRSGSASSSPPLGRVRPRSSQLLSPYQPDCLAEKEDGEVSQESEIDMETSFTTMAWRAGVMKKTLGKEAERDEKGESGVLHRDEAMTPPPRTRDSSISSRESLWRASKMYKYRPSYKLKRQTSDNVEPSERDSSSEEEELFDLSFDTGSATSGSTPSFSPFSSYRRSTSSSTTTSSGNHPPVSTPKPYARLSREYFPLSPPTRWDDLNEGATRQSWSETEGGEIGSTWNQTESDAQQEILAAAEDITPKPDKVISKIPSISSLRRPQAPILPMRRPSDASSTSTSSTSSDSIKFAARPSRSSADSSLSSKLAVKSVSPSGSKRGSVASTDSSFSSRSELRTSFEALETPPPLPNKSFDLASPSRTPSGIARPTFARGAHSLPLERAQTPSSLPRLSSAPLTRLPTSPGQIPRPPRSSSQPCAANTPPLSPVSPISPSFRPPSRTPHARLSSLPYLGSGKLILPGKIASATASCGTAAGSSRIRPPGSGGMKPLQLNARSSALLL